MAGNTGPEPELNGTKTCENDPETDSENVTQITKTTPNDNDESHARNQNKPSGFDYWRTTLKSAKYVVAPMVDASELAWRLLSRRYGAELCYTPMLHANVFVKDARYRTESLQSCSEDRPLIVQFCANDPEIFCQAAKLAAPFCDGIDLNLGCPQAIARRGNYGAFLQDEWDLISKMIKKCHEQVPVPISAKIRVFDDVNKTIEYAKMLESAGCQLLTVHGRTREMKGMRTGLASWSVIKSVKQSLKIPVLANGNIQFLKDADNCMEETGVEGVMSAEGNLHNPAIFRGIDPPIWQMAEEYLAFVRQYPCPLSYARGHLFKLFQHFMPRNTDLRAELSSARDLDALESVVEKVKSRCLDAEKKSDNPYWSGLVDNLKLPFWLCQPYERPKVEETETKCPVRKRPVDDTEVYVDGKKLSRNQLKKLKRNPNKRFESQSPEYELCACQNPRGLKCEYALCRACCKKKSYHECLDCSGHNFKFLTKKQKLIPEDSAAEVCDTKDKN